MAYIYESPRQIPVVYETDVCVVGGSATGVFAAVRAARLGARVVIVEAQNSFGGTATNGLVSVWHTFNDTEEKKQVIAGLSEEVLGRMEHTDHIVGPGYSHFFNPVELKCELDRILCEQKVKIYLHTLYCGVQTDGDEITAIFIENKDGRGAIRAKFFIDATGDGDLCRDLGIERYENPCRQPPSYVFLMQGSVERYGETVDAFGGADIVTAMLNKHHEEFALETDWGWSADVPGLDGVRMRAATHVFGVQCACADDLTRAELVGREKMRKAIRVFRKYGDPLEHYAVVSDCSCIGVRDTYHYKTKYQANHLDLLLGKQYEDCIMRGTYNIDAHHDTNGITFMRFDGTYTVEDTQGNRKVGNWREENGIPLDLPTPTFYELPFRTLVMERCRNLIAAGRMIHATDAAFGALRVMVNLNQIGEAAGVAAYLALQQNCAVQALDGVEVARLLAKGGSANLG